MQGAPLPNISGPFEVLIWGSDPHLIHGNDVLGGQANSGGGVGDTALTAAGLIPLQTSDVARGCPEVFSRCLLNCFRVKHASKLNSELNCGMLYPTTYSEIHGQL